ncbi:DUF4350 domain-containing protein [Arcanobacterium ihumii]|uniref:DUF4350 domain-containing protein n=1 Tax=Arcanobacterium ihumii TaxID=2138162 RepID=UPI000F541B54|nr:DUF4350 domain-containing protein [Arcanobacterium ihumii]
MSDQRILNTRSVTFLPHKEKKSRAILVLVLVLALLAALVANLFFTPLQDNNPLSPNSTSDKGSAALATLLKDQGVKVQHVTSSKELKDVDDESTILVTNPSMVSDDDIASLVDADARILILGTEEFMDADRWGFSGSVSARPSRSVIADCDLPAAKVAEEIGPTSTTISSSEQNSCFVLGTQSVWATASSNPNISFFGAPQTLSNKYLDKRGNAAFALHILGAKPKLFWLQDFTSTEIIENKELAVTMPPWLYTGSIAVLVSGLWLAVFRMRRFGSLVPESMPVIVPAGETQLGRARLYTRGKDYPHAASVLRADAIQRFASRLGLHRYSTRQDVVLAFVAATNQEATSISNILYDRQIRSERDLHRLGEDLNELIKEISHDKRNS